MTKRVSEYRLAKYADTETDSKIRSMARELQERRAADEPENEKRRRIYYQDIVYSVCNIIDKQLDSVTVCGSWKEPTTEVIDKLKSLLTDKSSVPGNEPEPDIFELRDQLCEAIGMGSMMENGVRVMPWEDTETSSIWYTGEASGPRWHPDKNIKQLAWACVAAGVEFTYGNKGIEVVLSKVGNARCVSYDPIEIMRYIVERAQ